MAFGGSFDQRRMIRFKPDKDNPQVSGFRVKVFHQAISPDIPIEHKNIGIGIFLFDDQGVFDRILAADPGTVDIFFVSGTHALDHDHGREIGGAFFLQNVPKLNLGHHPRVLIKAVFLGRIFTGAGSDNDDAMLDGALFLFRADQNAVLKNFPCTR